MSDDYSDRPLELAAELRETALRNLGRSSKNYRSSITGRFISSAAVKRHPTSTASTEKNGGSTSSRR